MDKYSKTEVAVISAQVNNAYNMLDFFTREWSDRRTEILEGFKKAERKHRRINDALPYRISVDTAAKLFFVKWLACGVVDRYNYSLRDLTFCQLEMLQAYALGLNYKEKVYNAWSGFDIDYLSRLDYAKMV